MKYKLILLIFIILLVSCSKDEQIIANNVSPIEETITASNNQIDHQNSDQRSQDEIIVKEEKIKIIKRPTYQGEDRLLYTEIFDLKSKFDYQGQLFIFKDDLEVFSTSELQPGLNTLEIYCENEDIKSETSYIDIYIVHPGDEEYIILYTSLYDKDQYKIISKDELNDYTFTVSFVELKEDEVIILYEYALNGKKFYREGDKLLKESEIYLLLPGYYTLIYSPEVDWSKRTAIYGDLTMYSVSRLWEKEFTSFIDFEDGRIYIVESFYDDLTFNEENTAFVRISEHRHSDYYPLEKKIEVEIYKISNDAIEMVFTEGLEAFSVQFLEWNQEELTYFVDVSRENEYWEVAYDQTAIYKSFNLSTGHMEVDMSEIIEEQSRDDYLNDMIIEAYETTSVNGDPIELAYGDIDTSLLTDQVFIEDNQIFYWFEIMDKDGNQYYTCRVKNPSETINIHSVNVQVADSMLELFHIFYLEEALLPLDMLVYRLADIGGMGDPGEWDWRVLSLADQEQKHSVRYTYQYDISKLEITDKKRFALLYGNKNKTLEIYGVTKAGFRFLQHYTFDVAIKQVEQTSDDTFTITFNELNKTEIGPVQVIFEDARWHISDASRIVDEQSEHFELIVIADILNVRSAPSRQAEVVEQKNQDDVILVYDSVINEDSELWHQIAIDQWVISDYCYFEKGYY